MDANHYGVRQWQVSSELNNSVKKPKCPAMSWHIPNANCRECEAGGQGIQGNIRRDILISY